ncbi:MAG: TatD family hydrolase [Planctomycetota bacterium]
MAIFEPHIHMISRTTDDYERMALAGITHVVEPAFWMGQPRRRAATFFDYFEAISGYETERAARFGIEHYCTVSLNPKEANNEPLAREVLAGMRPYLDHERVLAVGEIGFDSITDAEEWAFRAQIEMACDARLPLLIHTPHVDKGRGTERTVKVLQEMGIDKAMVLIDHNTEETTGFTLENGYWAGHTIYPVTKLTPQRAVNLLQEFGTERMLINSSADWGPSDPLNVPKAVQEMRFRRFTDEQVRTVVWSNPVRFYRQSGRLAVEE